MVDFFNNQKQTGDTSLNPKKEVGLVVFLEEIQE